MLYYRMFQSAHSLIADAEDLRKRRARNAMDAVRRTQLAMADANLEDAGRWIARAYRLAPDDSTVQLLFASIVVHSDPAKALAVLDALLLRVPWHREAAMARCAALLRRGQAETAARALG